MDYRIFLKYKCRLTNTATNLILIWPPQHEAEHLIETNKQKMYFMLKGDSTVKLIPENLNYIDIYKLTNFLKLICVNNTSNVEMIWTTRLSVLRYITLKYISDKFVPINSESETIVVQTDDNNPFASGNHKLLPSNNKLLVTAKYDGKIVRMKDEKLYFSERLKANETIYINNISFGETIFIYYELDCIYHVVFQKYNDAFCDDEKYFSKLILCHGKLISFPYHIHRISLRLKNMSKVKKFINQCLKDRKIKKDALQIIMEILEKRI